MNWLAAGAGRWSSLVAVAGAGGNNLSEVGRRSADQLVGPSASTPSTCARTLCKPWRRAVSGSCCAFLPRAQVTYCAKSLAPRSATWSSLAPSH